MIYTWFFTWFSYLKTLGGAPVQRETFDLVIREDDQAFFSGGRNLDEFQIGDRDVRRENLDLLGDSGSAVGFACEGKHVVKEQNHVAKKSRGLLCLPETNLRILPLVVPTKITS